MSMPRGKEKRTSKLDRVKDYIIMPGLIFHDEDLKDTLLYKLIEHQEWLSFCRFKGKCHPDFIVSFYQNLYLEKNKTNFVIRTKIGDKEISVCEATISKLFQLPLNGLYSYPSRQFPSNDVEMAECFQRLSHGRPYDHKKPSKKNLKGEERLVLKAITDILLPADTNDPTLSYLHAFVLDCLLRKVKLNLPKLMMLHIESISKDENRSTLVYGMAITALLEKKGLSPPIAPSPACKYLNVESIGRQKLVKYEGVLLFKWEVEELPPEAQAKLKPKPKIPLSSLCDQSISKIYPELVRIREKLNEVLLLGNTLATMDQETHKLLQKIYLEQVSINKKLNEILVHTSAIGDLAEQEQDN